MCTFHGSLSGQVIFPVFSIITSMLLQVTKPIFRYLSKQTSQDLQKIKSTNCKKRKKNTREEEFLPLPNPIYIPVIQKKEEGEIDQTSAHLVGANPSLDFLVSYKT